MTGRFVCGMLPPAILSAHSHDTLDLSIVSRLVRMEIQSQMGMGIGIMGTGSVRFVCGTQPQVISNTPSQDTPSMSVVSRLVRMEKLSQVGACTRFVCGMLPQAIFSAHSHSQKLAVLKVSRLVRMETRSQPGVGIGTT